MHLKVVDTDEHHTAAVTKQPGLGDFTTQLCFLEVLEAEVRDPGVVGLAPLRSPFLVVRFSSWTWWVQSGDVYRCGILFVSHLEDLWADRTGQQLTHEGGALPAPAPLSPAAPSRCLATGSPTGSPHGLCCSLPSSARPASSLPPWTLWPLSCLCEWLWGRNHFSFPRGPWSSSAWVKQ
jgi:hypothetical protein